MRRSMSLTGTGVALAVMIALVTPATAWGGTPQTLVVVSDTSGTWVNHFRTHSGSTALTYDNIGCIAVDADGFCTSGNWPTIPGAHWVWNHRNVSSAQAHDGVRPLDFTWTFSLPDDATAIGGTLQITADNAYRVFLNGMALGHDGQLDRKGKDGGWQTIETYAIQPVAGANTITVRAAGYRSSNFIPYYNPAGIIFRADISYEE
jgi:hypothetical protein